MASKKKSRSPARGRGGRKAREVPGSPYAGARELIVIAKPEAGLRASATGVASRAGVEVGGVNAILRDAGASLVPIFGSEDRAARLTGARLGAPALAPALDSLSYFYRVRAADERLDDLASRLAASEAIASAYIKPGAEPPFRHRAAGRAQAGVRARVHGAPAAKAGVPGMTPDFSARQGYLDAAPGGIDARFAWLRPGGKGAGVSIIDIEGAWQFTHENLIENQGGVIGGTPSSHPNWRNHGTAVVGEFGADEGGFGCTGICPQAHVRAISIFDDGSSVAIRQAADALHPGDILLIELHRPGPLFDFADRLDQRGYIAVEWWPDDFAAIVYATTVRGVIVVEAAGNGGVNFDDALYDTPDFGFPPTWTNPFRMANPQSGAIVVGAGAPPPGTHGRDHGADRSRLGFSNWGARVDAQGWGEEVTTCGYGDLQGGDEDMWYTDQFSGTSSASPIVVGALGCVQGALRAAARTLMTPVSAVNLLRTTGSPQQSQPGRPAAQRIGNRPDLWEAFGSVGLEPPVVAKTVEERKAPRKKRGKSAKARAATSRARGSARSRRK